MHAILPELRRQTCKQSWSPFSHRNPVKTQTNEPNQHLKTVENFQKKEQKSNRSGTKSTSERDQNRRDSSKIRGERGDWAGLGEGEGEG